MIYFASFLRRGVAISMLVETPNGEPRAKVAQAASFLVCGVTNADKFLAIKAPGNLSKERQIFKETDVLFWILNGMPPLQGAEMLTWE